jgi:type I restriction enzyme M protein
MTQQQLESYLFGAADLLRGLIDAADFKQYIFPLVFFKRVSDVWDEEFQAGLEFIGDGDEEWVRNEYPMTFNIPEDCHWNDVRNTAKNVGAKLQSAFINIEAANPTQLQGIFGTFGDTVWTNSLKFTDAKIKDLLEHFSAYTLSTQNVPADLMGAGYEFLIKKFADDGGHTAAEFYTNRTVVRLMTMLCDPQPDETIYDPTCGSGGMLIEAWAYLKQQQKEHESLWLYGQEKNIITSSIARMNMALHNISNFDIKQGDTLDDPKFLNQDTLQQFDVILANPPYSIKKWNRKAF